MWNHIFGVMCLYYFIRQRSPSSFIGYTKALHDSLNVDRIAAGLSGSCWWMGAIPSSSLKVSHFLLSF
jgi:hypothetical protein